MGEAPGLLPAQDSKAGRLCQNISIFLVSSVSFPGKALRRTPILCLDPLALAHTHVITVIRSFKHLKTLILLKRSKMEELLKAMISWEREEFKSGQIEE